MMPTLSKIEISLLSQIMEGCMDLEGIFDTVTDCDDDGDVDGMDDG